MQINLPFKDEGNKKQVIIQQKNYCCLLSVIDFQSINLCLQKITGIVEEETAAFRNEITRLNNIIDILLDSNRQLKNALAFYQQTAILPANLFDVPRQQTESIEKHQQPIHNRIEGMQNDNNRTPSAIEEAKNLPHGIQTGLDGAANVQRPMRLEKDGVNNVQDAVRLIVDGVNIVQHLISSTVEGVNNVQRPTGSRLDEVNTGQQHTGMSDGGVNNIHKPVDKTKKEVKPVHYQSLPGLLREVNSRATWHSTEATAKILIRLETSPKQSIKNSQKLTGLSEDGMVKRIMAMKKFGLITRGKGRQLLLTEKAMAILDKAREP